MQKIIAAALIISLFACNQKKSEENKTEVSTDTTVAAVDTASVAAAPKEQEITTKTGKILVVSESHPKGMSMSDMAVYFKGDTSTTLRLSDKDPISKVFHADLDGNGFEEVYVITTSAGSGSYGNVHGISSNKDKSLSLIYIPEVEEKDLAKGGNFEGYEGHDLFEINGKQLIRTFPVDKKTRKIIYELMLGEANYILRLVSSKVE